MYMYIYIYEYHIDCTMYMYIFTDVCLLNGILCFVCHIYKYFFSSKPKKTFNLLSMLRISGTTYTMLAVHIVHKSMEFVTFLQILL